MARKRTFWDHPISKVELQPPAIVSPSTTVGDAVREMQRFRIGCVLIVDEGKLVGIMSHGDVMHDYVGSTLPGDVSVDVLMTEDPSFIPPSRTVREVAEIFNNHSFRHLPVVSKGEILGILSVRGLMTYIGENLPTDVLNLPPSGLIASERSGG